MAADNEVIAVDDAEKRARKERKKEKKRLRELAAATTEPEVDVSDKKKKKRKREEDAEPASVEAVESAPSSSKEKEKKKKRKHSEEQPVDTTTPVDASKDKHKKKQKKDRAALPTTTTTAPTPTEVTDFLTKHSITIHLPDPPAPQDPVVPTIAFTQLPSTVPASLRSCFEGFKEPTPIQACTWPPGLDGKDVVGIAETGSGKTLAFGIPALARLLASGENVTKGPQIKTLVVAPTRELAIQTHETLSALGADLGIGSVAVFGGVPKEGQIRLLRNMNAGNEYKSRGAGGGQIGGKGMGVVTRIVVGTPGRILDLVQEGVCDLSGVDYLVLDEADRMLDKGFENDIRKIISFTKQGKERQTMMFSATWPDAVRRLASTFQQDPIRVTVGSDDLTANSRVEQSVEVFDDARSKDTRLLSLLRSLAHKKTTTTGETDSRILVFALYKKEASRVENMLRQQGYAVGAIHGDLSQGARMEALENFKNGTTGLLVATDVAARGLDIPNVGAVVNYTFPLTIEDYIHRIGRTGRGGKTGKSITFFTGDNHERSLAGELARVLRESGFECPGLKKFPMTIKKKEHGAYGAFFRDDIPVPKGPTKIVF